MALTSIPDQKTPGRPIEITFAPELGLPTANQEVLLIGHAASGTAVSSLYKVTVVSNVADVVAMKAELNPKFGAGSEIVKMVEAAIKANAGGGGFPALKVVALDAADTGFGASDVALRAVERVKAEFVVSPYASSDQPLTNKLKDSALLMSGATRTDNNQFGTIGVAFERATSDPATLFQYDTQFLFLPYLRDTGTGPEAPVYSVAEMAAAVTAKLAQGVIPFNPVNDLTIGGIEKPKKDSDILTIGAGAESEATLNRGYSPLKVKPNGEVAFVRSVTARLSLDGTGSPVVGAYYDVQDFQVLYFFRKTVWTRVNQSDFKRRKASLSAAQDLRSEIVRLMKLFEGQSMFQSVDQLAKKLKVERSLTDRHRFDTFIPVNVIPTLQVIAQNINATTEFDSFSI